MQQKAEQDAKTLAAAEEDDNEEMARDLDLAVERMSPRKENKKDGKKKSKRKREPLYRYQALPVATVLSMLIPFTRTTFKCQPCIVVDPFMGTGSTGIAARALDCYFVGVDIDTDTTFAWEVQSVIP